MLRDFEDRGGSYGEKIKETLMNDLNKIWTEIYKPDKFIDKKLTDFF